MPVGNGWGEKTARSLIGPLDEGAEAAALVAAAVVAEEAGDVPPDVVAAAACFEEVDGAVLYLHLL